MSQDYQTKSFILESIRTEINAMLDDGTLKVQPADDYLNKVARAWAKTMMPDGEISLSTAQGVMDKRLKQEVLCGRPMSESGALLVVFFACKMTGLADPSWWWLVAIVAVAWGLYLASVWLLSRDERKRILASGRRLDHAL